MAILLSTRETNQKIIYTIYMDLIAFLCSIILVLLGAIGYFVKRTFDRTDVIGNDVADMKPKVKILWEHQFARNTSPLTLNERGAKILYESGIKDLVEANVELLMQKLSELRPKNAYQVQECSTKAMRTLTENPSVLKTLQDGAFKTGVNVDAVLFVGAIYLRDLALPKYNFKLEDIDHQEPKTAP